MNTKEKTNIRGFIASMNISEEYKSTTIDSQWIPTWLPINSDQKRSAVNLTFRIPLSGLETERLGSYEIWLQVFTTDSDVVNLRPPNASEGSVDVRGYSRPDPRIL